ncbi:MAG: GrpB family protein [Clostridium sp.]|nr:GrpB family protein [Clostridium sp.]MCM1444370.1 GrpB family protein [Candidatus Amulumruptor caecigallinarius]
MDLGKLNLEKLWELFPITFTDCSENFKDIYLQEENILKSLIGNYIKRINHIGSTSIKNIKTKPIVDILIEIDFNNKDIIKNILSNNNYILMSEINNKISFNKGYTINGYANNVFHIHIKKYKDCDELYFRDYLNDNLSKAKEYEKLKLDLYDKYKPNRDLYTAGKKEFVIEIVRLAKEKYKNRY